MTNDLLQITPSGLYCEKGSFYIDPWRPVDRALITHAHGDHARFGSARYLAHHHSVPILRHRLGAEGIYEGIEFGETLRIGQVDVTFYPAGHIVGSAQILVSDGSNRWVVTGDFKREDDLLSGVFEPVQCDTLITESTFGLPIFRWRPQAEIIDDIGRWWSKNASGGVTSVLLAYSLGKAQRVLGNIDAAQGPIFAHGAIKSHHDILRPLMPRLPIVRGIAETTSKEEFRRALVVAPPSAAGTPWLRRFAPFSLGVASGWMAIRGNKRRKGVDRGFVLSDHADWDALNRTVKECGASRVLVTHGYTHAFSRWLKEQGIESQPLSTQFSDNDESSVESPSESEVS